MKLRIVAAFAAVYLVWGSTYLAIAYAVESIPPLLMMGVRSLAAGAVLYGWARAAGAPRPAPVHWRTAALAGALLFLGGHGLLAWAELYVASGLAALLTATGSLWMILLEWAWTRRERPGALTVAGAVLGLAGVGLLLQRGGGVDPAGAAAVLVSALLWCVGALYARGAPHPTSLAGMSGMQLLAGGAWLVLASALTGELGALELSAVTLRSAGAVLYLVVFGSIVAFSAYTWLMRVTSSVLVSTHLFVNPPVAVLLGWLVGGETITARLVTAGALIVGAVLLIARARASARAPRVLGSPRAVYYRIASSPERAWVSPPSSAPSSPSGRS